ncbi:HAMP domain-containing sensor histidine kinase [Nocardioides sp.]|uniref:sensor histidine kinase n=1 Tax=Nocardioides sp. TaxID=35761 RepID=UPI00286EA28B|nr:HAMP domain-containing sensor histidine kinase [Nocardioides sp.]
MRGRLTLAFVCFAFVMVGLAGAIRLNALAEVTRSHELEGLTLNARFIGTLVEDLEADGLPVTPDRLAAYVLDETELTITRAGSAPVTVADPGFDTGARDEAMRVDETVGSTTVSVAQDASVLREETRLTQGPLLALLFATVLMAGLVGLAVSTALARPFRRLAESAAALGRGRFDFEPPKSTIPEVVSIATSLKTSAIQLQDSLQRDREFFHHASHVLRTPLTGLRLELEELSMRDDLNAEVRRAAARSLADAERLEATVTDLLNFARARSLVAGAEVSVLTLGSDVAQRWRDQLPESREVRAYVDGGPEFTLTPGPVEQLVDSVVRDNTVNGTGAVTLRFAGQQEHVKVTVSSGPGSNGGQDRPSAKVAETIAEVLGGRCRGDATSGELEILLPRR